MKILAYNWRDIKNPDAGGAEVFTHEILKRLVEKGHDITLFSSKWEGCKKDEIIDGINLIRDGGKYTVYLKAREYYKKYFSRQDFDIIIDEINTIPFMTPKFVNNGEKIIALIHQLAREFWFYETKFPINFLGYYLENSWLKLYKDISTITVSRSTEKDLINLGFKNVNIVPEGMNFINFIELGIKKEKVPTLIFVGRFKKAKLPHHAIKAFKILKNEIPNLKLWMIGDGYYRKELEKMACEGITFFGVVKDDKKLELMNRSWIILVPGVREGWGLVITEANSVGTSAIGYDVNGLRDSIKDNVTGLLCQPNPRDMAIKIEKLLLNNELREYLSRNAINFAQSFNWEISSEKFINIIKNRTQKSEMHEDLSIEKKDK